MARKSPSKAAKKSPPKPTKKAAKTPAKNSAKETSAKKPAKSKRSPLGDALLKRKRKVAKKPGKKAQPRSEAAALQVASGPDPMLSASSLKSTNRSTFLATRAHSCPPIVRCLDVGEATQCVQALAAFRDNYPRLMGLRQVCGVDIGRKICGNRMGRQLAVRVHVSEKLPVDALPKSQRIAKAFGTIPTDVIIRDYRVATADLPLGGDAVAPEGASSFGTMGVDVFDGEGRVRMLTAAHVVARNITQSTRMQDEDGDFIGTVGTRRGTDWQFGSLVDCALIDPPTTQLDRRGVRQGVPEPLGIRRATERDILNERTVIMRGARTERISIGRITAVHVRRTDGDVLMEDHIEIMAEDAEEVFAMQGDSGAVCMIGRQIIGLLRAVDTQRRVAIACQMSCVREELSISLD